MSAAFSVSTAALEGLKLLAVIHKRMSASAESKSPIKKVDPKPKPLIPKNERRSKRMNFVGEVKTGWLKPKKAGRKRLRKMLMVKRMKARLGSQAKTSLR